MAASRLDLTALVSAVEAAYVAKNLQRWARAVELFERAARVAEAELQPDSLASIDLRLRAATALLDLQRTPGVSPSDASAHCARAWAIIAAASRTLTARADEGTLLPGSLRADEVAYVRAVVPAELRVESPEKMADGRYLKLLEEDCELTGYESFLRATVVTLGRLIRGQMSLPPLEGAEADAARAFVLRAFQLVTELRHNFRLILGAEARLVHLMVQLTTYGTRGQLLDARFYDELVALWRRPDVVAALQAHGALAAVVAGKVEQDRQNATKRMAEDVAARGGFRQCALPECRTVEATVRQFKLCGGCRQAAYCCAEHARQHWKSEHKGQCVSRSRATTSGGSTAA